MRIYILSNINVKKLQPKLEPFYHNTRYISYIWSAGGLFQIENNKIYRIKIKDVLSEKTLIGAFPAQVDKSEFVREEECYQIAPRSFKEYTTVLTYRFAAAHALASDLEWVLEFKDDELTDNYFQVPTAEITPKLKGEILQFLNLQNVL